MSVAFLLLRVVSLQNTCRTPLQCVQNKNAWPTVTADNSGTPLVTDLSFLYAAFKTALQYAGSTTRLVLNDYK